MPEKVLEKFYKSKKIQEFQKKFLNILKKFEILKNSAMNSWNTIKSYQI